MITTNFYLDTRASRPGAEAPLKIAVTKDGSTTYIPIGVSLLSTQWDKVYKKVGSHPRKLFLNTYIQQKKLEIDEIVLTMMKSSDYASMTVTQIKKEIVSILQPTEKPRGTFLARLQKYADKSNIRTNQLYLATKRRIEAYDTAADKLTFEDITESWLNGFDVFLSRTSPSRNARNIHFRNIRAVFNEALDNEEISCYPFRKFKIKHEKTRKRSLTIDQLRSLFLMTASSTSKQRYLDCFKLIFMLCGINIVDLCALTSITASGRIEYSRAKTHRLYSIKVEPEAAALIEKYRGQSLLLNFADTCSDYRFFYRHLCEALRSVGRSISIAGLSSYWVRHTWATVAASLDIPKETIAAALGHGGNTITDIYIDFDQKKVDEANRKVLDWVLYGKK